MSFIPEDAQRMLADLQHTLLDAQGTISVLKRELASAPWTTLAPTYMPGTYTTEDVENAIIGACGLLEPATWRRTKWGTPVRADDGRELFFVLRDALTDGFLLDAVNALVSHDDDDAKAAYAAMVRLLEGRPHPRQAELFAALGIET